MPREILLRAPEGAADRGEFAAGVHVMRVIERLPGGVHAEHRRPDGTRCCVKTLPEAEWRTFAHYPTVERVVWFDPAPVQVSA